MFRRGELTTKELDATNQHFLNSYFVSSPFFSYSWAVMMREKESCESADCTRHCRSMYLSDVLLYVALVFFFEYVWLEKEWNRSGKVYIQRNGMYRLRGME